MKISNIKNNNLSFKQIYFSTKDMPQGLQKALFPLIKNLYVQTDASSFLDRNGVDIYIYSNKKEDNLSAKIAFADREGNVYKMTDGNYSVNTHFKEKEEEKDGKKQKVIVFSSNMYKVMSCVQSFFDGVLKDKSSEVTEKSEINTIFNKSDKSGIYIFR